MKINSGFKKSLLGTIIIPALVLCTPASNKENKQTRINSPNLTEHKLEIKADNKEAIISWNSLEDYDAFVRSTVEKYYELDIKEIYNFYEIKRDLPKYGFKQNANAFNCLDCQGAVYKEKVDSIYFYTGCSEELFERYLKYSEKNRENPRAELEERIRYYIKHEAAHAFYYDLAKKMGETYLFNVDYNNKSTLYNIQHSIVEEGVAEYIANKGELTKFVNGLSDEDFKKMIKEKDDSRLYDLGFKLVKSLLDADFHRGVEEFIRNPLRKEDLEDLPAYAYNVWAKYMMRISHGMWKPPRGAIG
jgi:hypothetical protein